MIHKAVILARGLGTRMQKSAEDLRLDEQTQRAADAGAKALIPMGDRPFLDYAIQELVDAGLTRICLVIAPENSVLRERYLHISDPAGEFNISFGYQEKPLGTADAVKAARAFAEGDSFVMVNCDNLYSVAALRSLCEAPEGACYAVGYERESMIAKGNIESERISRFAVVSVDADWNLKQVVEKPRCIGEEYAIAGKVYVSMNLFRFTPHIFDACDAIGPHPVRGEYEITSAVQYLIDNKLIPFKVVPTTEGVLDLTSKSDIGPLVERLQQRRLRFS